MLADTNVFGFPVIVITNNQLVFLGIILAIYIFWKWINENTSRNLDRLIEKNRQRDHEQKMAQDERYHHETMALHVHEMQTKKQIRADQLLELAREGRIHLTDAEIAQAARDGS